MKNGKEKLQNPVKIRKPIAPPTKPHKDKSKYDRKKKHKKKDEE